MMQVSPGLWNQLVAAYEKADAEAEAAYAVYSEADPAANDGAYCELEGRYEELDRIRNEHEAKLMGVQPPTVAGSAYQLKLFARSFQSVDLSGPPRPDEEREQAILRRIYEGLQRLAGAAPTAEQSKK